MRTKKHGPKSSMPFRNYLSIIKILTYKSSTDGMAEYDEDD